MKDAVKHIVKKILMYLPGKLYVKLKGLYVLRYWMNIKEPKTFNEKINHRKFYIENELYALCADKVAVREYVRKIAGNKYLVPVIFIGGSITAEQLESYGVGFVAKTTHDSGNVHIVNSINADYNKICKSLMSGLQSDYSKEYYEWWYEEIYPQIIVEKLLLMEDGSLPVDYKFHVFNRQGKSKIIVQIDYDRFTNHNRSFYDEDLKLLKFSNNFPSLDKVIVDKPGNFPRMIKLASELAADFDYVRVDLFNVNGEVYFGELTFAHASGWGRFIPAKYDLLLGTYWDVKKQ